MESEQSLLRITKTAERVLEVCGAFPIQIIFLAPVQEILWLIVVCVFWWLFFYKLYHPFKIHFQVKHCKARQNKLLKDHWDQSEKEQAAVDLYWPLEKVHPQGQSSLRQRKSSEQTPNNPGKDATSEVSNGSVAREILIPVKICCMCTLSCGEMTCKRKLKKLASKFRASRQHITCLEADFGCVAVQTQLHLDDETADKLLREIAARKFCTGVTVQLGRWRACSLVDGEVKPINIDESVSSDESDRVPVVLNSSYKAGILTVEGLNLAKASMKIVSKHGDCITLETGCYGVSEPGVLVSVSDKILPSTTSTEGKGGLEMHAYSVSELLEEPSIAELLDETSIAELSVIAFKTIVKDGCEVRVSSLPVQIQDDSLKTVLRDIFPSAVIVFYAAKQILSSVGYATLIVAWLISFMIVALTSILPESTESTIRRLLKTMTAHVRILYDAYKTFNSEVVDQQNKEDADDSEDEEDADDSEDEEDADDSENEEDTEDYSDNDGAFPRLVNSKAEVEAAHGSRFVYSADWQWPIYDTIYRGDQTHLQLREESKNEKLDQSAKTVPFEVVYLNIKQLPWASQVQVNISSPFLKGLLPVNMDRWKCTKKVKIDGPELFRNYEILSEKRASCVAKLKSSEPSSSADASRNQEELQHITHLVRFMDKEFEEIKPMYAAMDKERQVTWEMLWAFFPPGEKVIYVDEVTDECVCGKVLWTKYQETDVGPLLLVKVTKWDYNCQSWKEYTNKVTVPAFAGDRAIKSLNIRPYRLEEDPEATEKSFLDHGKRFCELSMMQSNCYMNYKGSLVSFVTVNNCLRIVKENADGRVMIDLGSFSKMNPDYHLGSAKPPCEIIRDNIVITLDVTRDLNRMFAPSFVYGFSFRLKKWGCFSVAGFSDIEFNVSAYDDLVMNPATKALLCSLVQERLKEASKKEPRDNDRVDPIANKGDGCILLCYGPPGTGKTLTAESLSEKLQCPLWCLNAFELGVTPAALEMMLVKVLDVAASWGAILLLDEADVYLERRSSKDLIRNSMTGVFLRHLEYYRGVLFLTTNRDSTFDEAICSRITMFLYYGRHDEKQRSAIWKTLFHRVGLEDNADENLAEFSKPDFNGREITKIVKTAQTLAKSKDEKLEFQHVREASKVYEESYKLRTSLNLSTDVSLPIHQQPTKFMDEVSNSEFAPTPPEPHSSSTATIDLVNERQTLSSPSETIDETPTSPSETIEETPSSNETINDHVTKTRDFYLS